MHWETFFFSTSKTLMFPPWKRPHCETMSTFVTEVFNLSLLDGKIAKPQGGLTPSLKLTEKTWRVNGMLTGISMALWFQGIRKKRGQLWYTINIIKKLKKHRRKMNLQAFVLCENIGGKRWTGSKNPSLDGGFKYFLFSSLVGEDSHFD